jgi:hypothetical protein
MRSVIKPTIEDVDTVLAACNIFGDPNADEGVRELARQLILIELADWEGNGQ